MSRQPRAQHRLTITLYGDVVDVLDAIALAEGRSPAEAAAGLLTDALEQGAKDGEIQQLLRARRRRAQRRRGLRAVPAVAVGSSDSGPGHRTVPASDTKGEVVAIEAVASF